MRSVFRAVGLCAAVVAAFGAFAQREIVIAGSVFEDRMSLAVRSHFVAAPNVTVKVYRDGSETPLATTKTDRSGLYSFKVAPGSYWVAVDSRSFNASAWPEQTFGPGGSLCAHPDGGTRSSYFEGACFSGRTAARSDDASTLSTSEHVALVKDGATNIDFAFSYDAVTNTVDGAKVQGSLRQFLENANVVAGPSRMRFVPLERAKVQRDEVMGVDPRWWSITAQSAMPEIRDDDTILDGTAYNFLSPASIANPNPGRIGESPTFRPHEAQIPRIDKPELELILTGEEGLVCNATCAIARISIHGTPISIATRADARLEHVMIGTAPDATITPANGAVGLQVEKGTTFVRYTLVTNQARAGILVGDGAKVDAQRVDISRCGQPESGGGVVLLSSGSTLRLSSVAANPGAGIIIGSLDGRGNANGNTIDGCTISSNQAGVVLAPGTSRNVITRNDIMWNRLGGVTVIPHEATTPAARENRLSANRFNENGLRPIVLDLTVEDPNALVASAGGCERRPTLANGGISAPKITAVRVQRENGATRATIRGNACPGEIVEVYQSFVTSGVRGDAPELPQVRKEESQRESLTNQDRTLGLPSIGEFNYLGATNTAADGTFEASFPLPVSSKSAQPDTANDEEGTNVWASEVIPGVDASDRAFSAIAIDAAGNTSEMSVRRKVDGAS